MWNTETPSDSAPGAADLRLRPWSQHVAVQGPGATVDAGTADGHAVERRAIKRRVDDAAEAAVRATLPGVAWAALVLGAVLALFDRSACAQPRLGVWLAWALITGGGMVLALRSGPRSARQAPVVWAAHAAAAGLIAAPWLVCAAGRPAVAALCSVLAVGLSAAVCMLPRATWLLAAAPVVMGASVWAGEWTAGLSPFGSSSPASRGWAWLAAGALGSGAAFWVVSTLHQRWRQALHALIESLDSQRRREHERNEAWRKDHEKSRFLAIASHDLRQPVHALGLFAATLQRRLERTADEPLARNLTRAVDGLERSFTALLDISKLDAGALEPRIETFALRDMFRRLHMQYAGQAELAGLGLRFSTGGKSITSDPQLLERMVGNLIHNAIKYTTQGGIVVVARTTRRCINLEVWDTGTGIGPNDLPRIFDEFFQVGRAERDRSHGLGMGLAIVKRLAALLGHRLEVASAPGRGTRFRIGVPIGGLGGIQEDLAPADTQPMPVQAPQLVLVVDDEEPIREGLRLLLQEWGYNAMTASDARQADQVAVALEGRIDIILSDLHLGEGPDGTEAIASVRRLCGRDVPAILITGDTAPERVAHVAEGDAAVLIKPVQPRQLLEALRAALR